ncbi:MFS transporter [Pediococcus ethanolidurans]|uniref:MFS transporter n=1 Tax=Pediococcus ethanolidurans TaxID=319653 RepID=UPI001C1E8DCD|nr:MFS transporter [Pediococcus ethanolidurans]MBU7563206.1 MFS transporter [Pediococcus ethanolidurans]MCV3554745.1 MFS transporter [Pediococcus ethanolidurans]
METKFTNHLSVKRTISANYHYSFWAFFSITSLWVIYLTQHGMSLIQVGLLESIFHIASLLFEVPSGTLADHFPYKTVLILGRVMAIISGILFLSGAGFWWFALAFIIQAFSYNLNSGTNEALVFETLKADHLEKHYLKITANLNAIYELADMLGLIVAGFFVHWHFSLTYVIYIFTSLLAIGAILRMQEPHSQEKAEVESATSFAIIVKTSWQFLTNHLLVAGLMLFLACYEAIGTTYFFYFQTLMTQYHFTGWQISAVIVIAACFNIVGAKSAPTLEKHWSKHRLILGLVSIMIMGLLVSIIQNIVVLTVCFVLIGLVTAVVEPIFNDFLQQQIPSNARATLLSVMSMMFSLVMIILFPVVGALITWVHFSSAFFLIGICLLLIGLGIIVSHFVKAN